MAVFFAGVLASAVVDRLRVAVEYAEAGSPFQGLFIPKNRLRSIPAGVTSAVFCYFASSSGRGVSDHIPRFKVTDTLNIDGFVAQGVEAATALDDVADTLIQGILDLLLTDTTFLEMFAFVADCNPKKQDAPSPKEMADLDVVEFRIELVLESGVTEYAPDAPADARLLHTAAAILTVDDAVIEADFQLQQ